MTTTSPPFAAAAAARSSGTGAATANEASAPSTSRSGGGETVGKAARFLSNPSVASVPFDARVRYLKSRGLTDGEIADAVARLEEEEEDGGCDGVWDDHENEEKIDNGNDTTKGIGEVPNRDDDDEENSNDDEMSLVRNGIPVVIIVIVIV